MEQIQLMGSVGGKEEEGSTQQFKVNGAKNKSELLAFFFLLVGHGNWTEFWVSDFGVSIGLDLNVAD